MKIRIEERQYDNEVLFFMEAESVEDAAIILRITGSMKQGHKGYCGFYDNEIIGRISVPLAKNKLHNIESGKTST